MPQQCLLTVEVDNLVERHGEAQAGLQWCLLFGYVQPPRTVGLLDAKRLQGVEACLPEAELPSPLPDRIVHVRREFRRDIKLPAELADVRDPTSPHRRVPNRDLAGRQVGKRLV